MERAKSLTARRLFTPPKSKAYDQLAWTKRDILIVDPATGNTVFQQLDVEFPESWPSDAAHTVARHYFNGGPGTADRESSLKHVVDRIVDTIARQGLQEGYFETADEAEDFREELKYLLVTQRAAFDSPVWRSIGVPQRAQPPIPYATSGTEDALKPVVLSVGHPDIEEFIWSKATEDSKLGMPKQAGTDVAQSDKGASSVRRENEVNTVRVDDHFMQAVASNDDWRLLSVATGRLVKTLKARKILRQLAEAVWKYGSPGVQFDSAINRWNTVPSADRISAGNPGGEYPHLNNSACNLAGINLLKYLRNDNSFDVEAYRHTIGLVCMAQEILLSCSAYPTPAVARNAKAYRELGLGCVNLNGLLVSMGLLYDSDEGRAVAAALVALITGQAYATSAKIARRVGPFAGYRRDQEAMLTVLRMHRAELSKIDAGLVSEDLLSAATTSWDEAVELGELHGVRNSQVSVLTTTDAISSLLSNDTSGIGPSPSAVADKQIADADQYMGYVKMMSELQPFVSGSVDIVVTLPGNATVEDVEQLYVDAWRMGLKAITISPINRKTVQSSKKDKPTEKKGDPVAAPVSHTTVSIAETLKDRIVLKGAVERPLPRRYKSMTSNFQIDDLKGSMTVSEYEDGTPADLSVSVSAPDPTFRGLVDAVVATISQGLQYGVPLRAFVGALVNTRYAPLGTTDDPDIQTVSSITDYIARRLALDYLSPEDQSGLGAAHAYTMPDVQTSLLTDEDVIADDAAYDKGADQAAGKLLEPEEPSAAAPTPNAPERAASPSPLCYSCGNQTQRVGSFYICVSCGSTTGCS